MDAGDARGHALLNSNDRMHWRKEAPLKKNLRQTACWLARAAKIPSMKRASIIAVYEPPDRRRRDPANLYPSWKAVVDGIVDAGVLPDDNAEHLDGPDMRLGDIHPQGRLVMYIEDLTDVPPPAPVRPRPSFRLTRRPVEARPRG
ncbi:RusA family crossover junction endodeoxyribonuclease [Nonomuraea recticatena]|uniref:hypothetical protein n=1 Tax=Nonomuraea recticatena TaxID=46178 RepID=UPI00361264B1